MEAANKVKQADLHDSDATGSMVGVVRAVEIRKHNIQTNVKARNANDLAKGGLALEFCHLFGS
jgi:hypothetical protein